MYCAKIMSTLRCFQTIVFVSKIYLFLLGYMIISFIKYLLFTRTFYCTLISCKRIVFRFFNYFNPEGPIFIQWTKNWDWLLCVQLHCSKTIVWNKSLHYGNSFYLIKNDKVSGDVAFVSQTLTPYLPTNLVNCNFVQYKESYM